MPLMTEIPENWREPAARVVASLRGLDRVLVAAHVNPDGDALGSMSALGWLLKAMGKEFVLYSPSGVPEYLSFLSLPCTLLTSLERLPFEPRALVLLDCGEPHRLGDDLATALEDRFAETAIINIDHHLGSDGMGTVDNWIEPAAAATAQLAAYVCLAAGLRPEGPLGESLALGLVTDTGGFLHGSTTAAVFRLAALLSDSGCDIHKLREKLDNNWSPARMALWARLMQRVEISCDGRAALALARLEDLQIGADLHAPKASASSVVGGCQVIVPLKGAVDLAGELARLDKEMAKLEKDLVGVQSKLHNESFVSRAPAQVVERERARAEQLLDAKAKMQALRQRFSEALNEE